MYKSLNISLHELLFPLFIWIFGILIVPVTQLTELINPGSFTIVVYEGINSSFYLDVVIIFSNNLALGLMMVYLGYFTFGLFSLAATIFNSIMLGSIITDFLKYSSIEKLIGGMIHAPFEIFALSAFAAIGLKNLWMIDKLFRGVDFKLDEIPSLKSLYLPVIILFISSIIESLFRL